METKPTLEDCLLELGRLYIEAVLLRKELADQQQETARIATELGRKRLDRGGGLVEGVDDLTAAEARKVLEGLNLRLMGRAEQRPKVENAPQG